MSRRRESPNRRLTGDSGGPTRWRLRPCSFITFSGSVREGVGEVKTVPPANFTGPLGGGPPFRPPPTQRPREYCLTEVLR